MQRVDAWLGRRNKGDYLQHEPEGWRQWERDLAHDEPGEEVVDKCSHSNLWHQSSIMVQALVKAQV